MEQNSKKKDCFFLNKRFEEMVEKLFFKLNEQFYLTNDFTERSFYEKKKMNERIETGQTFQSLSQFKTKTSTILVLKCFFSRRSS